ncbi:molybdopterin-guanine dinucleotide biosynthesis protein B [Saliniramus sp.]|uniref:molybdopterin-guanine dinucleotide biosynthesis protein B n=1 Tax=Saliniramus sp. TaxID=2986772 RepID=UPI002C49F570|nr:molybdopterin-guanine dinucleotide biosynthesis protein B [Saliniramus sp.]HMB10318.1 molybdopterin-guanine dinucleotide biosynthesis protein B [Saliniramus sp.]
MIDPKTGIAGQRLYGVTGWKNAGKTGLVERLVAEIVGRGYSVSTIKHAHHNVDIDEKGRDTYRHREAGAQEVVLASANRWALMHELRGAPEPALAKIVTTLTPVDLVIVEGYKRERHPKIEAYRHAGGSARGLLAHELPTIRAIASDTPLDDLTLPVFDLDDTAAIADFVLAECGLI